MPTVSVVIPTYNGKDHLRRAIRSVLDQQFNDLELVVVDDASTDVTTETVVGEFDDPRVRCITHSVNRGGSAARNTGIDATEGEYIAFLDDDDMWLPHKLDRQVACLEDRSEEWVAVYTDLYVVRHGISKRLRRSITGFRSGIGGGEDESSESLPEGGAELIPSVLMQEFPLGGASVLMVRREAAEQIGGFNPEFPRHQDWEFLIRLLQVGKIAAIDEPLIVKHESGRPSGDSVKAAKHALFSEFSAEVESIERDGYNVTATHRFDLARYYYMNGYFLEGTRWLRNTNVVPIALLRALLTGLYSKVTRLL